MNIVHCMYNFGIIWQIKYYIINICIFLTSRIWGAMPPLAPLDLPTVFVFIFKLKLLWLVESKLNVQIANMLWHLPTDASVFVHQVWICWPSWWSYSPTPVCFTRCRRRRRRLARRYSIARSPSPRDFSSLSSLTQCAGFPSSSWRFSRCWEYRSQVRVSIDFTTYQRRHWRIRLLWAYTLTGNCRGFER